MSGVQTRPVEPMEIEVCIGHRNKVNGVHTQGIVLLCERTEGVVPSILCNRGEGRED